MEEIERTWNLKNLPEKFGGVMSVVEKKIGNTLSDTPKSKENTTFGSTKITTEFLTELQKNNLVNTVSRTKMGEIYLQNMDNTDFIRRIAPQMISMDLIKPDIHIQAFQKHATHNTAFIRHLAPLLLQEGYIGEVVCTQMFQNHFPGSDAFSQNMIPLMIRRNMLSRSTCQNALEKHPHHKTLHRSMNQKGWINIQEESALAKFSPEDRKYLQSYPDILSLIGDKSIPPILQENLQNFSYLQAEFILNVHQQNTELLTSTSYSEVIQAHNRFMESDAQFSHNLSVFFAKESTKSMEHIPAMYLVDVGSQNHDFWEKAQKTGHAGKLENSLKKYKENCGTFPLSQVLNTRKPGNTHTYELLNKLIRLCLDSKTLQAKSILGDQNTQGTLSIHEHLEKLTTQQLKYINQAREKMLESHPSPLERIAHAA